MGKIIQNGIEYSGTYSNATSINYDSSVSGLNAKTVQEAVDELAAGGVDNGNLSGLVNFSSEEKLIGTWIDGKPLYTKTIQFTPTSNGYSAVFFSHDISNVETIYIDGQNSFEASGTVTTPIKLSFGITDAGAIKMEYLFEILSVDSTKVSYRMGPSASVTSVILTLRYTKTID